MKNGSLNHSLKTQGGLGVNVFGTFDNRSVTGDMILQGFAQIFDIDCTGDQHFRSTGIIQ